MSRLKLRELANKFTPDELLLAIIFILLLGLLTIISLALFHLHP